jgi:hypothetical protein
MIILRQKYYATGVERTMAKQALDTVGKRSVPDIHVLPLKTRAKIERTKRNVINGAVDTVNNPAGAAVDLVKDAVTRPMNTAGKVAIAIPFPASVPAGAATMYLGDKINKNVKPLRKLSEGIRRKIENTGAYKKIKGINLKILKRPYKKNDRI